MKDLIKLERYHKQVWPKEKVKELEKTNKTFKLNMDSKNILDLLYLQVFEESLKNKKAFETEFNSFHQKHEDMWLNMTFKERNFFIQTDMDSLKKKLKHFKYQSKSIYIAFFNKLMNVLYDEETAILDLPQFFKLYEEFDDEIISPKTYGIEPFLVGMATPYPVAQKNDTVILFDRSIQTLFKVTEDQCETYPLYQKSKVDTDLLVDLSTLLLKEDYGSFYAALEENKLMSPRLEKKFIRKLKRRAK